MKTLLVIILCLLSSFIYSQNKLKNRLEGFEKMILDSLYSNYDNKISGYDLDQYNIRIIPSVMLTLN